MLHRTLVVVDKTKAPHKYYKYGYQPDPRKLMPIASMNPVESKPVFIRPPHSHVPDVEAFLDKIEVSPSIPTRDFATSFDNWADLMTTSVDEMMSRGIPRKSSMYIDYKRRHYNEGNLPEEYKRHDEIQYWRQFNTEDGSQKRMISLPEKYRPHQLGEDNIAIPNYVEINQHPAWATKKE